MSSRGVFMSTNSEDLADNLFAVNTPTLIRLNSFFDETTPGMIKVVNNIST